VNDSLIKPVAVKNDVYLLVLLGGGHSHVLCLKYWQQLAPTNPLIKYRPLLISEKSTSPYSGMLPGLLTDDYQFDDCHIDLIKLCQLSAADFLQKTCVNIQKVEDPDFDTLYRLDFKNTADRHSIYCEKLSINIGSQPYSLLANKEDQKPGSDNVWKVKPINQFFQNWQKLQQEINKPKTKQGETAEKPIISIIGAGAAGVEIACAIKLAQENCQVQLIASSEQPLPSYSAKIQKLCLQQLNNMNIRFIGQRKVTTKPSDFTILCTQSAAPSWLKDCDLKLSEHGFICIDENLQTSLPGVFSAGDCAHFTSKPLAKAGVYAVRQASTLFHNLCTSLKDDDNGSELMVYQPQLRFLSIINMGNQYALGQRGSFVFSGRWLWHYKQYLDKKFMSLFNKPNKDE
jgi:selenide,water dikinase